MQGNNLLWRNLDLNAIGYFSEMYTQDNSDKIGSINGGGTVQEPSSEYALLSKSYAVGGTGIRQGEDTDNAKYYYEFIKYMMANGNLINNINIIYGGDAFSSNE